MNTSDRLIISELKNHNKGIFEALFKEYHKPLLRYAENFVFNRDVCEDIVQSVFISVWENAPVLEINISLKAYLFQAVRFKALTHLRNLNIQDKHKIMYIESHMSEMAETESDEARAAKVNAAVTGLPKEMAKIFRMKYIDGIKVKEIAEQFNISENTVKTQLKRARLKIKSQLGNTAFLFFSLYSSLNRE